MLLIVTVCFLAGISALAVAALSGQAAEARARSHSPQVAQLGKFY